MKKLLALVLALVLVLGMGVTAFAVEGENDNSGSITIDKAHLGTTYSIYQILVLDSYNTDINSYVYSPASDLWKTWIQDTTAGGKYLVLNENGTVKWNGTATAAAAAAFAQEALAYAETNGIAPAASATATADAEGNVEDVVFSNLNLGYWLVDSSAGALCSLDTVMPNTIIEEKNPPVLVDKKVQDHEGVMQEAISSRIGKVETFMSKITLYAGSENVVYHDVMQNTIDYIEGSVEVYLTPVANGNPLTAGTDYVVNEACTEHDDPNHAGEKVTCTFEVTFSEAFLKTITQATDVTVVYKGALNKNAIIAGNGNINDAMVTFGDDGFTTWDDAKLYTYQFGIVKTDISNHVLEGAEFDLYYSATGDDLIALVEELPTYDGFTAVSGVNYYRPATDAEKAEASFVSAKIVAGKACVWGIRDGVAMYLEETQAPAGYNPLAERAHITALQSANNIPEFDTNGLYIRGGVEVENLAGAQLPQTGGIGTTLFYVLGGIMVAAAVVVLVTKKRMSTEE